VGAAAEASGCGVCAEFVTRDFIGGVRGSLFIVNGGMRILLILIILVAAGAAYFHYNADFRETLRPYWMEQSDKDRFEAYKKGKSLFAGTYKGPEHLEYRAWGDEGNSEQATLVSGSTWLVRGIASKVDSDGSKSDLQWCMAYDRSKGTALAFESGEKATEALKNFDNPGSQPQPPKTGAATPNPASQILNGGKPTPVPGAWMWKKDGPLDKGPYNSGSQQQQHSTGS